MSVNQDAELFGLVQALLEESRGYQVGERRGERRMKYDCVQLVAPFDGQRMPSQAEFRRVRCRDLASGGFSYYADQPPEEQQLIVALGAVPFSFFVADVLRVKPTDADRSGSHLVACRFARRLKA